MASGKLSKVEMIAQIMSQRLRPAGIALKSDQLAASYRAKTLLPGLQIQIEIHKECLKPRSDRFIRIRDKTENRRARLLICSHLKYLNSLCHSPTAYTPMSIFGRISGPGFTQSGYACHSLDSPLYFIDKIVIHDTLEVVSCPERIGAMLESPLGITGSFYRVLPWMHSPIQINSDEARSEIRQFLSETSHTDPYMSDTFRIQGPGEGFVFFPEIQPLSVPQFTQLSFVASATRSVDQYSVLAQKIGSEPARRIQNFVQHHVTADVLEENSRDLPLDKANTRQMMNNVIAFIRDKQKEMKIVGLPQAEMEQAVGRTAAEFFIDKCNKI